MYNIIKHNTSIFKHIMYAYVIILFTYIHLTLQKSRIILRELNHKIEMKSQDSHQST